METRHQLRVIEPVRCDVVARRRFSPCSMRHHLLRSRRLRFITSRFVDFTAHNSTPWCPFGRASIT